MRHFRIAAVLLGTVFLAPLLRPVHAAEPAPGEPRAIAEWILARQYRTQNAAYGAVANHADPGVNTPVAYYRVRPYQASLALRGLALAGTIEGVTPQRVHSALRAWIEWYLNHMVKNPSSPLDGVALDHWYRRDGTGETTKHPGNNTTLDDHVDAEDSVAATLLELVGLYVKRGGSTDWLIQRKADIRRVAAVIVRLQDTDGLTWARHDFRVKYLMDNSEVYAGLRAMKSLEETLFGNPAAAARYERLSADVKRGVGSFFDPTVGLYRTAKHPNGKFDPIKAHLPVWYPDTTAQVWPLLFGVESARSARSLAVTNKINTAWRSGDRDWTRSIKVDPDRFPWPSVGYAMLLTGTAQNRERAKRQAQLIKNHLFPPGNTPPGPFVVSDAGWLLPLLLQ